MWGTRDIKGDVTSYKRTQIMIYIFINTKYEMMLTIHLHIKFGRFSS